MPTIEELGEALLNADRAGDTAAATKLADEITRLRGGGGIGSGGSRPLDTMDMAKSAGVGPLKGLIAFAGSPGDLPEQGARALDWATRKVGGLAGYDIPAREAQTPDYGYENLKKSFNEHVTPIYEAKTPEGRVAGAVTEAFGNPLSYYGPGTMALKLGGSIAANVGGEAAGIATEGTRYEVPARLALGIAAGAMANKALGAPKLKAEVPDAAELKTAVQKNADAIVNSNVYLNPEAVADRGFRVSRKLTDGDKTSGLTPITADDAPKTSRLVEQLTKIPPRGDVAGQVGARAVYDALGQPPRSWQDAMRGVEPPPLPQQTYVTPADLMALRRKAGAIAKETTPASTPGGRPQPTMDAKAAMVLREEIDDLMANPPDGAVLAGDIGKLQRNVERMRGNAAAMYRIRDVDFRQNKADVVAARNLTGSVGQKYQADIGGMAAYPTATRGWSPEAKALVEDIAFPSGGEELLRQAGRVANYSAPMAAFDMMFSGGLPVTSLPYIAGSHIARKLSDKKVISKVEKLVEQLGKESPLYKSRERYAKSKKYDLKPGTSVLLKALLQSQ